MKVTCETKEETFNPVTISITCETKEELFALWHRFNVSNQYIWEGSNEDTKNIPNGYFTDTPVWDLIDKEVQKIL